MKFNFKLDYFNRMKMQLEPFIEKFTIGINYFDIGGKKTEIKMFDYVSDQSEGSYIDMH